MYGPTNVGGGISPFAFIFATYPAGSVCTCTDGSRTLKLKDTSGYGVFYPPYAGTWIVTATDGDSTASQPVEITTEGQNVSVQLSYRLWLYRNGDECTDITGGWENKNYSGITGGLTKESTRLKLTQGTNGALLVGTKKQPNLTGYSKICAVVEWNPNTSNGAKVGLIKTYSPSSIDSQWNAQAVNTTKGTHTLECDISNASGLIAISTYNGTGYYSEIWLE